MQGPAAFASTKVVPTFGSPVPAGVGGKNGPLSRHRETTIVIDAAAGVQDALASTLIVPGTCPDG